MSVLVYIMSGKVISLNICEGFCIKNLRNEVYIYLKSQELYKEYDIDDIGISKVGNDDDLNDYHLVKDGDIFQLFIEDYDPEVDIDGDNPWD